MSRTVFPLTTVFTPPSGCGTIIPDPLDTISAFRASLSQGCFPPSFAQVYSSSGWYSPGICPYGYTVGYMMTGSMVEAESLQPSETGAFCAPSGWTVVGPSFLSSSNNYALAIDIHWQYSDLSVLQTPPIPGATPTSTSLAASSPSNSSPSSAATSSSSTSSQSPAATGPLSSGAKAGIAVGVTIVVLGVLAAVVVITFRRRKRRGAAAPDTQSGFVQGEDRDEDRNETKLVVPPTIREPEEEIPETVAGTPVELQDHSLPQHESFPPPVEYTQPPNNPPIPRSAQPPEDRREQHAESAPDAVRQLVDRRGQLQERRRRLLELHQIDQEEESIQQRLQQLQQGQQQQQPTAERHEIDV